MKLKDLKESSPIEVADYAVANRIFKEPAFKWWVSYTMRKRNRIISKVKSQYWKTIHKFGIGLPKTTDKALQIDKIMGTDLCRNSINKEMSKFKIEWEVYYSHTLPIYLRSYAFRI